MKAKDYIKEIFTNKIILLAIWACFLGGFIFFLVRYNMYLPARNSYNEGVEYLQEDKYDKAQDKFREALDGKHSDRDDCKMRINLALSICLPITPDKVTADNLKQMIRILRGAIDILCENDCAHMDDMNGHNAKAQDLKQDIEDYIRILEEMIQKQQQQQQQQQQGGQGDPQNQGGQGGQGDPQNQGGQGGQGDPQNQGGQNGQDDPQNQGGDGQDGQDGQQSQQDKEEEELRNKIQNGQSDAEQERNNSVGGGNGEDGYNFEEKTW